MGERMIVPYMAGSALQRASAWATLPDDERRRRAVAAAHAHDADTLCALADAWLTIHGKAGARVSAHTRAAYRRGVLLLLAAWRGENLLHPRRDAGALWLRQMEEEGAKPATITVRLAAARTLYAALRWAGATEADPLRDAHAGRDTVAPWEKRKPYSERDVAALLAAAMVGDDRVLVLLGAHAGLRVSEMLALTWADVDLGRRELLVRHGKGDKPRTVTVSKTLAAALDDWRAEARRRATTGGQAGQQRAFVLPVRSAFGVRRRLRLVCARAGVEPRGIHSLRHSSGTRVMDETGSLEETARHLGHATVETSRVYAKWSNKRLQATVGEW
jgi:integrase